MQETWVWSQGREDPLEKKMVTHFSILSWEILWAEEPGQRTTVHGVAKSQTWHDSKAKQQLVVRWLRFHALDAGGPGLIPGQGTRSKMLQWVLLVPQLKFLHATTKTWGSQNKWIKIFKKCNWLRRLTSPSSASLCGFSLYHVWCWSHLGYW